MIKFGKIIVLLFTLSMLSASCKKPTAVCNDGELSYSRTDRGTCSHHGGVDYWVSR